jgi:uncharacterized membrane protein (UPF0127 family)
MASFLTPLVRDSAQRYALHNRRTGRVVADSLIGAFDSATRRTGLLGRSSLEPGTALIIAPSNAVHTFFMRFPIDIVFVTRDGRVAKVRRHVRPWRIAAALTAFAVIELPAGSLDSSAIARGDSLAIVAHG